MRNTKFCPICGVKQVDGKFYFSYLPNKEVSSSEVYSKVCRRAKETGCINTNTEYSSDLDFPEATDAPAI